MAYTGEKEGLLTLAVDYLSEIKNGLREAEAVLDSQLGMSLPESYIQSVKDDARAQAVEIAGSARDMMTEEYLSILDTYYGEYPPKKYKRTGNLHDNSWEKYYAHNPGRGIVYGGIIISPDKMAEVYHDSASYVFNESYLCGWHGGVGIKASLEDPYGHMDDYLSELENTL